MKKPETEVPSLSESIEEAAENQFELVKLIMQLAVLEQKINPLLPVASKKLVNDLLESGCSARTLGAKIGRNQGFIRQVAAGEKSLSAMTFTVLVRHAMQSGANNAKT